MVTNKFKELPWVGTWERRPLELVTLRLQIMLDISIKSWKDLAPGEKALRAGVLQLRRYPGQNTRRGVNVVVQKRMRHKNRGWIHLTAFTSNTRHYHLLA